MKQNHYFKRTLSALLLLLVSTLSWAYDFEAKNADGVTIYYNLINNGEEAEVTNYNDNSNSYSGDVNIPETVVYNGKTLSVTSIGESAFEDCDGLTSLTIPESVTSIGNLAFADCDPLSSVILSSSLTSIGKAAFMLCRNLTSITISENVTSIGERAFSGCRSLTSVYSLIENPFEIANSVFERIADDATLYVPKGTKEAYETTEGWAENFSRVVEFDATGIADTPAGCTEDNAVYSLNGTKMSVRNGELKSLPRGIYIVNGKKMLVE